MIIRSKAPLRLGLAGGGTDVSPFCDKYGGAVINVTINMYSYCTIVPRTDGKIIFNSPDRNVYLQFENTNHIDTNGDLLLHKGIYNRIVKDYNGGKPLSFEMTTYSDAPAGSGLGTSSTMVVTIIKAFMEWLNLPLGEYDAARLAYDIERNDLKFAGGKQDQYSATFGGLNYMEFYDHDKVIVNPLRLKKWIKNEMENSIVLYFTGKSRDSGKIIDQQMKSVFSKNKDRLDGMMKLKKEAVDMKECILTGNFDGIADTIKMGWEAKKQTSSVISNPQIENTYNFALSHGAKACKISGAGGGGFMMIWCDPEKRYDLIEALKGLKDGQVYTCQFVENGMQAWTLYNN